MEARVVAAPLISISDVPHVTFGLFSTVTSNTTANNSKIEKQADCFLLHQLQYLNIV